MDYLIAVVFKVLFKISACLVVLAVLIAGAFLGNRFFGGDLGWLFGAMCAFPVCCIMLGPMFLLIRIDENLSRLRRSLKKSQATVSPIDKSGGASRS
jgi:hypothetical protein